MDKGGISDDELAVIVGVRPGTTGGRVRHVEGKDNLPPSSAAVEMMEMDAALPSISLGPRWAVRAEVPAIRSKVHGHRGIAAYDPTIVEYVKLDAPYYYYPVSCATRAQAEGIARAFSRSVALTNSQDPRQVVFTVLPGHGVMIAERWVRGKAPFQAIWEYMDAGYLEIDNRIPQGLMEYVPDKGGRMHLGANSASEIRLVGAASR